MNYAAIHTVVHTSQEPERRRQSHPMAGPGNKTRAKDIPALDDLPAFMLVPDDDDPKVSRVFALVDGVAKFKGRIWFVDTYKYGGQEFGEGWMTEIPGNEKDPDHFRDGNCCRGAKATAISRLLSSPARRKA